MKRLILSAAVAAAMVGPMAAESVQLSNGTTYAFERVTDRELAPGVEYIYLKCAARGNYGTHVYVTIADLTNPNVSVEYLTAGGTMGGSTKSLSSIAGANSREGHQVVAGANANFWVTSETPWKSQLSLYPHGTAVSNGVMYSVNPCRGSDAHMGGPQLTGSIAIGTDGRAHIRRFNHQFEIYNPAINHTMEMFDCNRVVEDGTASIYTPAYGRNKAFKPVDRDGSSWVIAAGTCTEVLCDLAEGESAVGAGGNTRYVIKEVRTGAGTGTLGNHDLAIVGRQTYGEVLALHYTVGREIELRQHFNGLDGSADVIPTMMQATSGNNVTMEAGQILTDDLATQSGYNNNIYARTIYGTNDDGTKLFIAVCGNKTSTYYGMSTEDLTRVLRALGATYASQVDCGGSSQMYAGGVQVNQSTDASGVRNVHSGMFVVVKETNGAVNPEVSGIYPDVAADNGIAAPEAYTLESAYADRPIAELAGKTVKRVIARGDYLYILALEGTAPTVVVYNHTTGATLRTLGTSQCIGNILPLSDIAFTGDGTLIGICKTTQPFTDGTNNVSHNVLTYKWANDDSGIPTGQAAHWNCTFVSGNWGTGEAGETMAYQGTMTGGTLGYLTPTNTSTSVRLSYTTVGSNGGLTKAWHNKTISGYTKSDNFNLYPSPFNADRFILECAGKSTIEYTPSNTAAGDWTINATAAATLPAGPHNGIFRYGGKVYMVSCASGAFQLFDISNGLDHPSLVGISQNELPQGSGTVAAVGTGVGVYDPNGTLLETRMAIMAVRGGAVTKYITPSDLGDVVVFPHFTTTATDTDFGPVVLGENRQITFNIEGGDLKGDITIAMEGRGFSVDRDYISIDQASGTVTVTFEPTAPGTYSGTLTIDTDEALAKTIALSGTCYTSNERSSRLHHAYGFTHEEKGPWVEMKYTLTGDVAAVRIHLTPVVAAVEGAPARSAAESLVIDAPASAGANSIEINSSDFPAGEYNWAVEVENHPVEGGRIFHQNLDLYTTADGKYPVRGGVSVINDPASEAYGDIITANGRAQGFMVFSPEHTLEATYCKGLGTATNRNSLFRTTSHNGLFYAIDYADAGAGIYEFDPENPGAGAHNIFAGTWSSGGLWTLDGTALGGGGQAICFTGEGDATRLWSWQEDYPTANSADKLVYWNIGESNVINMAPTVVGNGFDKSGLFLNNNINLTANGNKGLFVSQVRGNGNNVHGCPGFVYINMGGDILYNSGDHQDLIPATGGGLALSQDGSLLAVSLNTLGIRVFNVTWAADGTPSLSVKCDIPGSGLTDEVCQMAFDLSGNICAWMASKQQNVAGLNIFAMPHFGGESFATAAPQTFTLATMPTGVEDVEVEGNQDAEAEYYDLRGMRVDADRLTPGVYIKVAGTTATKVVIR